MTKKEKNILEKITKFQIILLIITQAVFIFIFLFIKSFFYILCLFLLFILINFIIFLYKKIIITKMLKEISPEFPKWIKKFLKISEKINERRAKKEFLRKPNPKLNTRISLPKLRCFTNPKYTKKRLEESLKKDNSKIKLEIVKKYNKNGMIFTKNRISLISPIQKLEFEDLYNKVKFSRDQILISYQYCYSKYAYINEKYLRDALEIIDYFGNEKEIYFYYPIDLEAPFCVANSFIMIWIAPIIDDEAY